jgi:hypothetical protein
MPYTQNAAGHYIFTGKIALWIDTFQKWYVEDFASRSNRVSFDNYLSSIYALFVFGMSTEPGLFFSLGNRFTSCLLTAGQIRSSKKAGPMGTIYADLDLFAETFDFMRPSVQEFLGNAREVTKTDIR